MLMTSLQNKISINKKEYLLEVGTIIEILSWMWSKMLVANLNSENSISKMEYSSGMGTCIEIVCFEAKWFTQNE